MMGSESKKICPQCGTLINENAKRQNTRCQNLWIVKTAQDKEKIYEKNEK